MAKFIGWLSFGTNEIMRVFSDGIGEYPSGDRIVLSIDKFKLISKTNIGLSYDRYYHIFKVCLEGFMDDPDRPWIKPYRTQIFVKQYKPIHVFGM
jgi:hypothetical protein